MEQLKFSNTQLLEAVQEGLKMSKESNTSYSCIILSKQFYYVENEPPLIRINEKMIAQFVNGNQIPL